MLSDVVLQLLYTDTTAADVSETVDSVSSFELGSDASVAMVVSNNQQSGREREVENPRGVFFFTLQTPRTTNHKPCRHEPVMRRSARIVPVR